MDCCFRSSLSSSTSLTGSHTSLASPRRGVQLTANECVAVLPKIIQITQYIYFFETAIGFLIISNHNSFRVLFDEILPYIVFQKQALTVTETHVCELLVQGCCVRAKRRSSNPRPRCSGLTEIAGLDIDGRVKKTGLDTAGLDNGGPDINGRIPLRSKVKQ